VPREARPELLKAAEEAGRRLKEDIRQANDKAIEAMKTRGLKAIAVTPAIEAAWQRVAESAYPRIRGGIVPASMFDEVKRLRDEFRAAPGGTTRGSGG
jgi:TRAP-type C4-dicarboxylate transport system substrate-binding protein